MEFKRSERVADLLQREIADIVLRRVKDPRVGSITITGVKVSDDLKHARIFYCLMGKSTDEDKSSASEGLGKARGFIRQELGKRLHLRFIPQLNFEYDASIDYGDHIERLLKDLNKEE